MVFTSVVICLFLDLFLVGVFLFFFFFPFFVLFLFRCEAWERRASCVAVVTFLSLSGLSAHFFIFLDVSWELLLTFSLL